MMSAENQGTKTIFRGRIYRNELSFHGSTRRSRSQSRPRRNDSTYRSVRQNWRIRFPGLVALSKMKRNHATSTSG